MAFTPVGTLPFPWALDPGTLCQDSTFRLVWCCPPGGLLAGGGAWGFELGSHQPQNVLVLFARWL